MDAAFAGVGPETGVGLPRPSPTSPTCACSPSPSGPSAQQFESQVRGGNFRDRCWNLLWGSSNYDFKGQTWTNDHLSITTTILRTRLKLLLHSWPLKNDTCKQRPLFWAPKVVVLHGVDCILVIKTLSNFITISHIGYREKTFVFQFFKWGFTHNLYTSSE